MVESKGFEDLIKNTVTTSFSRGQDNQVSELISVCEKFGFNYNKKEKVEPMTLKAFVREQVEGGKRNYHLICLEFTLQIKQK